MRRVPIGTHFPSSFAWLAAQNRKCIVLQGLTYFGAVAKRSVSFRFVPQFSVPMHRDSVSFRSVPLLSVWFRTDPLLPAARCLSSCLVPLPFAKQDGEAGFAAQNEEGPVDQGLTDSGPVAKRSVSFRNFPKLSVSFRSFPFLSVPFRVVPSRSRGWAGGAGTVTRSGLGQLRQGPALAARETRQLQRCQAPQRG